MGAEYTAIEERIEPVIEEEEEYHLESRDLPSEPDGAIKYALNLAEFPIFSKNDKIKENVAMKYVFNADDEYVRIVPNNSPNAISKKILQEFDEKLFYGILGIYEKTAQRRVIIGYPSLLENSGINYSGEMAYRAKDGLERMDGCRIEFNQVYYDVVAKKDGRPFAKRNKVLRLISGLETISFTDYQSMGQEERDKYSPYFEEHHKIKEIASFYINEEILKSIEFKAFKYFDHKELLAISNGTARKLHIMFTKWRYSKNNPNKNHLRRTAKFLASRIPLSWKKQNISGTIRTIKKACESLKSDSKLQKIECTGRGAATTFDFYFGKGKLYYFNQRVGTETTGMENEEIKQISSETIEPDQPQVDDTGFLKLLSMIPEKYRADATKIAKQIYTEKGADCLRWNIEYANEHSNGRYGGLLRTNVYRDKLWENEQEAQRLLQKELEHQQTDTEATHIRSEKIIRSEAKTVRLQPGNIIRFRSNGKEYPVNNDLSIDKDGRALSEGAIQKMLNVGMVEVVSQQKQPDNY